LATALQISCSLNAIGVKAPTFGAVSSLSAFVNRSIRSIGVKMNKAIRKISGDAFARTPLDAGRPPKRRPLTVVGISGGYHDSAACLMQDGVLVAAVQEERFSRIKHDRSFPRRAFRYCLDQAGLTIANIDCLAYY